MKSQEANKLRNKSLLFYKFLFDKGLMPNEYYEIFTNNLPEVSGNTPLRGWRQASNDIDEQIRELPLPLKQELKLLFKDALDIDLDIVDKKRLKKIENLLKRGSISTDEQYYLLMNRIDEIYADPLNKEEVDQINQILIKSKFR